MNSSDVVAGTNGTALQYNDLRHDLLLGQNILGAETDGATITFDFSDYTKGKIRGVTLGGNRVLAVSNVTSGQTFIIRLTQDGSGSRTVTWFSTITWAFGNSTPTLTTTGGKTDVFGFICTSTGNYEGYVLGQNI
jgi:hypothetical protein